MFLAAIQSMTPSQQDAAFTELERYFNGSFPCHDGNVLAWWKVSSSAMYNKFISNNRPILQNHANDFPVLALIARDVLAIPGVSIHYPMCVLP